MPLIQVYVMERVAQIHSFLGAFANLRKATVSFDMSAHLSVRKKQLE
jgi:hypothetical protein